MSGGLPAAEWIAAANECDAPVPLAGGGSEPAWRCGMEISVDMTGADVLEEIGRAANMRFAEVGGQIKPIVGLPGAAVFSLTDDDIIITEGQSFRPYAPVSETYNAISATYPEPAEKWATKDSPEYVDAAATAEDGGRYLPTGVSYPAAPYAQQVQRLQRSQLQDYRRMRRHQFHLPPEAYALEPGVDMVTWTSRRNGYVSKLFLVESVTKTRGMNVLVSLREVDPGDYDWDSGFEFPVTITPPVNPIPYVQPVPGFAVSETSVRDGAGQPRRAAILVQCDPDEAGITEIHIEARVKGEPVTISAAFAYAPPHAWYLRDVLPLTIYEVRARLLSDLTPVSEWSPWHEVTTLDITFQLEDLSQDILDQFEAIAAEAGIATVEALPAKGDFDNQIVMLVPQGALYRWDEAELEWTTKVYAGIPDGGIDLTKFATGIEPVTIIDSGPLPAAKGTETVFWQGKLYRWNGSEYTAAVPVGDLTGQISSTQISDNAVTTGKIAADAVTSGKIAANAVTAGSISTDAVIAGKISAAAVNTRELAAGAVTASRISVGNFENLIKDPEYRDLDYWALEGGVNFGVAAGQGTASYGQDRVLTVRNVQSGPSGWYRIVRSSPFSVKVSDEIFASFGWWNNRNCRVLIRVGFFSNEAATAYLGGRHLIIGDVAPGSRTDSASGSVLAGASHAAAEIFIDRSIAVDSSVSDFNFGRFLIRTKNTGELIVDGAITAGKIAANAVTSNAIVASAVTTSKLAAGAVTADKMSVNQLSAISATIGLLRTATSGARQEIHSDKILIYDANNVVRVRIGNLD